MLQVWPEPVCVSKSLFVPDNDFTDSVIMMKVTLDQSLHYPNLQDNWTDDDRDTIHDTPTQALINLELTTYKYLLRLLIFKCVRNCWLRQTFSARVHHHLHANVLIGCFDEIWYIGVRWTCLEYCHNPKYVPTTSNISSQYEYEAVGLISCLHSRQYLFIALETRYIWNFYFITASKKRSVTLCTNKIKTNCKNCKESWNLSPEVLIDLSARTPPHSFVLWIFQHCLRFGILCR